MSAAELAVLFEGRTRFIERLAEVEDPLGRMRSLLAGLPEAERIDVLNAHPRIGARGQLSALSSAEQGSEATPPEVLAELQRLNTAYEKQFGFRFVVFVRGRSKTEILRVLRERMRRTRDEEMETALDELVAIAQNRYRQRQAR